MFQLFVLAAVLYLLPRLSLTLPSIAVGESPNPINAWHLSSGSVVALLLIPIVAWLGAYICFIPVALIAVALLPESFMFVSGYCLTFMVAAVEVSALSVSFRVLRGYRSAELGI